MWSLNWLKAFASAVNTSRLIFCPLTHLIILINYILILHQNEDLVRKFLDNTLTSRLGIRMLCEHHLKLQDNDRPNYVGIINVTMKPKDVIEQWCEYVTKMSEHHYGRAPQMKVNGHVNVHFPYIQTPLDYILPELLKNAVRYVFDAFGHRCSCLVMGSDRDLRFH